MRRVPSGASTQALGASGARQCERPNFCADHQCLCRSLLLAVGSLGRELHPTVLSSLTFHFFVILDAQARGWFLSMIIDEWTSQLRSRTGEERRGSDSDDINQLLFSAIVQDN